VTKADWEMLHPGQTVEARVSAVNKGGLELEVAGHRAFMPASQVSHERIEDLSVFVGEKLTCRVQRVDKRGKGNIVLSRRDLLAEERKEQAGKLKETLKEGDAVEGTVRKLMPFGAFVDLGGVDGLVHLSDLAHSRVNQGEKNVEKFVKEGQKVRVQVLKLDWDANRISLGIKQLQEDPFEQILAGLAEGSEVEGTVTRCAEFGAFVEIAPGVEGLIHISELAYRRVNKADEVVQPKQSVTTKIVKIDRDNRRIGLSLKQMSEPPKQTGGGRKRKDEGPSVDEILKVTPQLRRMREKAKLEQKGKKKLGGLGGFDLGKGLGDLKL
jgi:small subunit ribosomal protein S1